MLWNVILGRLFLGLVVEGPQLSQVACAFPALLPPADALLEKGGAAWTGPCCHMPGYLLPFLRESPSPVANRRLCWRGDPQAQTWRCRGRLCLPSHLDFLGDQGAGVDCWVPGFKSCGCFLNFLKPERAAGGEQQGCCCPALPCHIPVRGPASLSVPSSSVS